MRRTRDQALGWVAHGTKLVHDAIAGMSDETMARQSPLPGWTRKHVLAHIAANAEAVGNLVHWAATGEETPMYRSAEQRAADIEAGAQRSADELRDWFTVSAERLAAAMAELTEEQWAHEVVTAQGRTVPASETPWMRSREVLVHAVDLDAGVTFADLPADFLAALGDDIVAKRSATGDGPALVLEAGDADVRWEVAGTGDVTTVRGPLADLVAWLSGRPTSTPLTDTTGGPAPELGPWI